jgi:hypothetical protein
MNRTYDSYAAEAINKRRFSCNESYVRMGDKRILFCAEYFSLASRQIETE